MKETARNYDRLDSHKTTSALRLPPDALRSSLSLATRASANFPSLRAGPLAVAISGTAAGHHCDCNPQSNVLPFLFQAHATDRSLHAKSWGSALTVFLVSVTKARDKLNRESSARHCGFSTLKLEIPFAAAGIKVSKEENYAKLREIKFSLCNKLWNFYWRWNFQSNRTYLKNRAISKRVLNCTFM